MDSTEQLGLSIEPEPDPNPPPAFVPRGYDTGHCKYCRARIIWVTKVDALGDVKTNPRTGKPIREPVDVACNVDGKIVLVGSGRARQLLPPLIEDTDRRERRISHWVTCPERKAAAAARDNRKRAGR